MPFAFSRLRNNLFRYRGWKPLVLNYQFQFGMTPQTGGTIFRRQTLSQGPYLMRRGHICSSKTSPCWVFCYQHGLTKLRLQQRTCSRSDGHHDAAFASQQNAPAYQPKVPYPYKTVWIAASEFTRRYYPVHAWSLICARGRKGGAGWHTLRQPQPPR